MTQQTGRITQELVKLLFIYSDGVLYWNVRRSGLRIGDVAGCIKKTKTGDRFSIKIDGKHYLRSRITFLYHNGYLPEEVDHIDRNKLNDKIENLRNSSHSENNKNTSSRINSTSKYLGVHLKKATKRWAAQININGKNKHLGYFDSQEEAALKYNEFAAIHHKEFANFNIIN